MTDAPKASARTRASEEWNKHVFRYLAGLAILVLALGTVVYHYVEDWSWVDAFYFSSVALTTVGFGDLTPSTDASKLFTVFYIFAGVSLVGAALNAFLKVHAARASKRRS
jgi:hypothetical protein